ncbi:MAG: ECF transporter S component [Lachnospiraceae bacterium]|nr:ECF transporter S component [Lachnospiraceae bacterium]
MWKSVTENVMYVLGSLAVVAAMFVVAWFAERLAGRKNRHEEKGMGTRKMTMIGMFSAIAMILYLVDFPLPFAPGFYKVDFSEIPVMVGTFAFGPVAGVMIEFCKILLKLAVKGTSTAFVGDLANFVVGCSLILPASIIYEFKKTKVRAAVGVVAGTLCMTIFGTMFNAVYLLPAFSALYGMPMDKLIAMGTAINPSITNVATFVCFAVAPMNLLKGTVVSVITMAVYKPLSTVIKSGHAVPRTI